MNKLKSFLKSFFVILAGVSVNIFLQIIITNWIYNNSILVCHNSRFLFYLPYVALLIANLLGLLFVLFKFKTAGKKILTVSCLFIFLIGLIFWSLSVYAV